MPAFLSGLAFKIIAGAIGIGAVVVTIMVMNANLAKKDAQIAERDQALTAAAGKIIRANDRVKEMARINAAQIEAMKAAEADRMRAYKEAADRKLKDAEHSKVITKIITRWRDRDETLDRCLALKLPPDFVRQLEH